MIFLTIWKNFFVAKSHMGTLLEWIFFTQKKKSVSVSGIFGRTNQKCFQYDQRPSYIILWKEGNFCKSNSYGHTMVLSSIYRDFFVFVRIDWKWSKMAINQIASSLVVPNYSDWSKSLIAILIRVCIIQNTPLLTLLPNYGQISKF